MHRSLLASLRVRILLLILIAVLPAYGMIVSAAARQRQAAIAEAQTNALRLARLAANDEDRLVAETRQLLVALGSIPAVQDRDAAACSALFANLLSQYPEYANLGAAAPNGDVFCSAVPTVDPVNIANRSDFQIARETGEFAIGDYQSGEIAGRAVINFSYPVNDEEGNLAVVVYAALDLDWLNQFASTAQLPPGSTIIAVDRNGTVLLRYPEGEGWVGQRLPNAPVVEVMRAQGEGTAEVVGVDGVLRLFGFTTIGGMSRQGAIYLAIGIPQEAVIAEANRTLVQNIIGLGLVTAAALVGAWVAGNLFILRRTDALLRAAERLRSGDLRARSELEHTPDELGQLARAFDEMAASLERTLDERTDLLHREQALARIGRALVQELDLEHVVDATIEQTRSVLHADVVVLWRADSVRRQLLLLAARTLSPATLARVERLPYDAPLLAARAAQTEQIQIVEDLRSTKGMELAHSLAEQEGLHSLLAVPLRSRGRLVGVAVYGSRSPRRYSQRDLEFNTTVADLFAVALENAQLYNQVRESLRLREEFMVAAAHELKTPVTTIQGWTRIVRRSNGIPERGRKAIEAIELQSDRIARLVEDLLTTFRLQPGAKRPALERESFDLVPLVRKLVEDAARSHEHYPVECATDDRIVVDADRRLICQTIENLIDNAIRYSPEREPIAVEARRRDQEAVVSVRDQGVGIPIERQPHVFEPFYEPVPAGEPGYAGTVTLGLSLSKQIVEAHGGHIWFVSTPGQGSTFSFSLPLAARAPAH